MWGRRVSVDALLGTGAVLVLAGSFVEAQRYARNLRLDEWLYCASPKTLRGLSEPTVYVVGTWYERLDLPEVRAALEPSRPRYLNEDGEAALAP